MVDAAKDLQWELESFEQMLGKEAYLDSEDNPLKLLRRLRALSDMIPAQQKEYDNLLHQEQEIAEKLREVAHRNSTLLEGLEQRTDIASHGAMNSSTFEDAYRKWEEDHIKETELLHDPSRGTSEVYQRSAVSHAILTEEKEKENNLRLRAAKSSILPAELTAPRTYL